MKKFFIAYISGLATVCLFIGLIANAQIYSPQYWRTNIPSSTITPLNASLQVPCANIVGGCGSGGGFASTTPFSANGIAYDNAGSISAGSTTITAAGTINLFAGDTLNISGSTGVSGNGSDANWFLGTGASPTAGQYNVGIGTNALVSNSSGNANMAIGLGALGDGTGETYNVAVGVNALAYEGGTQSVGIGNQAGEGSTLSNYNNDVFIGNQAGQSMKSGSGGLFLGAFSGFNVTSTSNAFVVGNIKQSSFTNDQNYSLLYGNFAGVAATTTGQFLQINGNEYVMNGNVGIGTAAPNTALDVNGAITDRNVTSSPFLATNASGTLISNTLVAGAGISVNTATSTTNATTTITNTGVTSFNGSTGAVTGVSSLNSATGSVSLIEGSSGNIAIQTTTTSTAILAAPLSIEDLVPTTSTPDVFHFPNTTTTISKILCNNLAQTGNTFTFGLIASTTIGTGSATNTVLSAGMTCNSTTTDQSTTTFSNATIPPNAIGQIWYSVASTTGAIISIYF